MNHPQHPGPVLSASPSPNPAFDLNRIRRDLAERAGLDQARIALREGRPWTPEDDRLAGDRFRDAMVDVTLSGRAFRNPASAAHARALLAGRLDVVATRTGPDLRERGTGRGLPEAIGAALAGDLAILLTGAAGPSAPPASPSSGVPVAAAHYLW